MVLGGCVFAIRCGKFCYLLYICVRVGEESASTLSWQAQDLRPSKNTETDQQTSRESPAVGRHWPEKFNYG